MIEITRDMLDRLVKKRTTSSGILLALSGLIFMVILTAVIFVGALVILLNGELRRNLLLLCVWLVLLYVVPDLLFKYIRWSEINFVPAGSGKLVDEAKRAISEDFISDKAVNVLRELLGQAKNDEDRIFLTMLLCDVHTFRGELDAATSLLNSIDRTKLKLSPTLCVNFFSDAVSIYSTAGDNESVSAAFSDGLPYFEKCCDKNISSCLMTLYAVIDAEKARGNYQKALELALMMIEFEEKLREEALASGKFNETPLVKFCDGLHLFTAAELFHLCGDHENAAKHLDRGGPLLEKSPFFTERANMLANSVRQALKK